MCGTDERNYPLRLDFGVYKTVARLLATSCPILSFLLQHIKVGVGVKTGQQQYSSYASVGTPRSIIIQFWCR